MACPQADLTISKGLFERRPSNASDGSTTRVFRRLLKGERSKSAMIMESFGQVSVRMQLVKVSVTQHLGSDKWVNDLE